MSRHDEIKNAYKSLGGKATFYDGMITCSTLPGKAVCKLVWNMDKRKNDRYLELVLSGIPQGEAAYGEVFRVLKPGGTFCGCFYVKGENKRTDWLIDKIYTPKGYFTPPYETADSLEMRLKSMYRKVQVKTVEGMAAFRCRKGKADAQF